MPVAYANKRNRNPSVCELKRPCRICRDFEPFMTAYYCIATGCIDRLDGPL